MDISETLTVREAALRLGCTTKYVYDLLYSSRLPGAHKKVKAWRIPRAALETRRRIGSVRSGQKLEG